MSSLLIKAIRARVAADATVQSLLGEEVFGHLEKPEHIREVRYLQELRSEAGEPAAR